MVVDLCCVRGRVGEAGAAAAWLGRENTAALLRCYNSCPAEGKLGFWENWAALQIRTLKPVRGYLQEG